MAIEHTAQTCLAHMMSVSDCLRFIACSGALACLALAPAALSAANTQPEDGTNPIWVTPQPQTLELNKTAQGFTLAKTTPICFEATLRNEAELLAERLRAVYGVKAPLIESNGRALDSKGIILQIDSSNDTTPESYQLVVSSDAIHISGSTPAGVFYGTQTLLQLTDTQPVGTPTLEQGGTISLPTVQALTITDAPRFVWRGMMIDVGRHFFPIEDLTNFLTWMAYHKLNTFHWHLTDDQGWRIEIKKYPKLTEVGGWRESTPLYGNRSRKGGRKNNKRHGGFYTQEQIKDFVAHATRLHINVVPEIEMPGHCTAALAGIPELGNYDMRGGTAKTFKMKPAEYWAVFGNLMTPTEEALGIIDDIFTEVCELFPSQYIHMGGDESPGWQWTQSPRVRAVMERENLADTHAIHGYFVERIEQLLASKGRTLVGWEEIRMSEERPRGASTNAVIVGWQTRSNAGVKAAKAGYKVVMAPGEATYLDSYKAPPAEELARGKQYEEFGGYRPVERIYGFDPARPDMLTPEEQKNVIGTQGQLWSELHHTWPKVEYAAFPRIAVIAESGWTQLDRKDLTDFQRRLEPLNAIYLRGGIHLNSVPVDDDDIDHTVDEESH